MSAVVTDQFRIANANNFVDSVLSTSNSYYVFLGLPNPSAAGFGRTSNTDEASWYPKDNLNYRTQYRDSMMFGKKINSTNIRRVIKKQTWTENTRYDMYRHDYDIDFEAPNSKTTSLYLANYYVMTSEFKVYICLDNGSSGSPSDLASNYKGERASIEPTFTDLNPVEQDDGYTWKYLFTVAPSDIIKFDSTDYIVLPNDWATSTDSQIKNVRNAGNSDINKNQIKKVYIEDPGNAEGYESGTTTLNILGDGTGAKVAVTVGSNGKITKTKMVSGGSGYTYGIVDLGPIQRSEVSSANLGKLVPIIPPSRGHGYDIYTELGADKVLIYARFDDKTKDFPVDTAFAQVGILKNPLTAGSDTLYTATEFSSLEAVKLSDSLPADQKYVGVGITQTVTDGTARGYIASYDQDTKVLKYFQDRSLFFPNGENHTDLINVSTQSKVLKFGGTNDIKVSSVVEVKSIDTNFSGITTTVNSKSINLGVEFDEGVAESEINKKTGDVIYISNRSTVQRDLRQKEDIKIVLEF